MNAQEGLHEAGVSVARIDGGVPPRERHDTIRRFGRDDALRVALVSVTAASLGIDLSVASHALFAELPPDAAWLAQAEDRLHRRGQATPPSRAGSTDTRGSHRT